MADDRILISNAATAGKLAQALAAEQKKGVEALASSFSDNPAAPEYNEANPSFDRSITRDEFVNFIRLASPIPQTTAENIFTSLAARLQNSLDQAKVALFLDMIDAPAPNERPAWIADDEAAWLQINGLNPIVSYSGNTVTVKLRKPGLSAADILGTIIPYKAHKQTSLVEAGFDGFLDGKRYIFTGTRYLKFTPTLSTFDITEDSRLLIEWEKADAETARRFFEQNKSGLRQAMDEAGLSGKSTEDYINEILAAYGSVVGVDGRHEYDFSTGYYRYVQSVQLGAIAQVAVNWAGVSMVQGSALKMA